MILSDQTAYNLRNPATYYDNHHLHMNCLNSRYIASAIRRYETQHDLIASTARSESAPERASRPYCRFHCHCHFHLIHHSPDWGDMGDELYC